MTGLTFAIVVPVTQYAVVVSVNGVNTLTGKPAVPGLTSDPQNFYVAVSPGQSELSITGFALQDGRSVRQFAWVTGAAMAADVADFLHVPEGSTGRFMVAFYPPKDLSKLCGRSPRPLHGSRGLESLEAGPMMAMAKSAVGVAAGSKLRGPRPVTKKVPSSNYDPKPLAEMAMHFVPLDVYNDYAKATGAGPIRPAQVQQWTQAQTTYEEDLETFLNPGTRGVDTDDLPEIPGEAGLE